MTRCATIVTILLLGSLWGLASSAPPRDSGPTARDHFVAFLRPGQGFDPDGQPRDAGLRRRSRAAGAARWEPILRGSADDPRLRSFRARGLDRAARVWIQPGRNLEDVLGAHRGLEGVARVEVDPLWRALAIPDDPLHGTQWALDNDGSAPPSALPGADIDAHLAWDIQSGDGSVLVAIVDTGVSLSEPELVDRLEANPGEIPGNGLDDDGNGWVDDVLGYDVADDDPDPSDSLGHGTHVAGDVGAAGDNGLGFSGVCWDCRILPIKVFPDGQPTTSASYIAEAMGYAAQRGARVVNLSLGGQRTRTALTALAMEAAEAAGLVIVAAAGNDGMDRVAFPGAYPSTIAVGATGPGDARAGFSNRGPEVDVVAPGVSIAGLRATPGDYSWSPSGTSFASPITAGVAALLLSEDPSLTPAQVRALLRASAEDGVGGPEDLPGFDFSMGWGRVNANQALLLLLDWQDDGDGDGQRELDGDCDDQDAAVFSGAPELCDGRDDDCDGAADAPSLDPGRGPVVGFSTRLSGDPDGPDYRSSSLVQPTPLSFADDEVQGPFPLGFDFPFVEAHDSLWISSNGFVSFADPGGHGCCLGELLPRHGPELPDGLLALWWEDLDPSAGGSMWIEALGVAPHRAFVVRFEDVPHWGDTTTVTAELRLDEDGSILFVYDAAEDDTAAGQDPAGATVAGAESEDGTFGAAAWNQRYDVPTLSFEAVAVDRIRASEVDVDGDGALACADCDEGDAAVFVGAEEVCDGLDDDCDGAVPADEQDADGDGFSPCGGDCDDGDPARRPGRAEVCDGLDDDCDGAVPSDEIDGDGDGQAPCEGDCDDGDPGTWAGNVEVCDGRDDDCVPGTLLGTERDGDGDGALDCEDCDDADPSRVPGGVEVCDGLDGDCDGALPADEGDADGDGWMPCEGDCDDADPAIWPGAPEACDGLDGDCDGALPAEERDADGDGWMPCEGDCDDADDLNLPGGPELCDLQDNDCDGLVDEDDPGCFSDDDDSSGDPVDDDDSSGDPVDDDDSSGDPVDDDDSSGDPVDDERAGAVGRAESPTGGGCSGCAVGGLRGGRRLLGPLGLLGLLGWLARRRPRR